MKTLLLSMIFSVCSLSFLQAEDVTLFPLKVGATYAMVLAGSSTWGNYRILEESEPEWILVETTGEPLKIWINLQQIVMIEKLEDAKK